MVYRKCKSPRLGIRVNPKNPAAKDLYCLDCGAWQKFANADDCRLFCAVLTPESSSPGWLNFRGKPKCPNCGAVWPEHYGEYNFCPNCGARVR